MMPISPEYGDVSLSEKDSEIVVDTEMGSGCMWVDFCTDDLPLCLKTDYISQVWTATGQIKGYDLAKTIVKIEQKDELVGYAVYTWGGAYCQTKCWWNHYNSQYDDGTWVLYDADWNEVTYLALGSNRYPEGALPPGDLPLPCLIPDKQVDLTRYYILKGCELPEQHFGIDGSTTSKNTEVGEIIVTYEVPDPVELCLTNETLANWNGTMQIKGYEPLGGTIDIYQKDVYLGTIYVEWTWTHQVECYYDYYTANFYILEEYIAIYSNQWPSNAVDYNTSYATIPGKEVHLAPENLYTGCHEESQRFLKIMAPEIRIPRVPNS